MLSNSTQHRGRDGADDFARVLGTDAGYGAHSLRHGIVVIAKNLIERGRPLWIFRLSGGLTMDGVGPARVRVRRYRSSYQRNRGIHRPLRHDWIDAKPLTHLLDSCVAHLLLNLLLN